MTFGSLFSGIGGIDLGLHRAGWRCAWQAEVSEFCSAVLGRRFEGVPNLGDVERADWTEVPPVDLIECLRPTGGGVRRAAVSSGTTKQLEGEGLH